MAFINFEKESHKNYLSKTEIEQRLDEQAKRTLAKQQQNREWEYKKSLKLEGQWMLPTLSDKLDSSSHRTKKKHRLRTSSSSSSDDNGASRRRSKKEVTNDFKSDSLSDDRSSSDQRKRKKKNKKKKKYRSRSISSDKNDIESDSMSDNSSSSDRKKRKKKNKKKKKYRSQSISSDEKKQMITKKHIKSVEKVKDVEEAAHQEQFRRDDWMNFEALVPTVEKMKKTVPNKNEANKCIMDAPGQSDRELNPYWKDGGTGLPSSSTKFDEVSDGKCLEWYQRALKRAEEQASAEGRTLEDVVSERWGSLDELKSLISRAEMKKADKYSKDEKYRSHKSSHRDSRLHHASEVGRGKLAFWKPGDDVRTNSNTQQQYGKGNWKKEAYKKSNSPDSQLSKHLPPSIGADKKDSSNKQRSRSSKQIDDREFDSQNQHNEGSTKINDTNFQCKKVNDSVEKDTVMTDEQLNALAAKLVKAEILGNEAQIAKLRKKLEDARKARENAVTAAGTSSKNVEETVILLKTTEKGFTLPVREQTVDKSGGRRKKQKMETHSGGQRVRYFHDDDGRDIRQMFESEKLGTADDEKFMFMNMMAKKRVGAGSDEEDAAFADAARMKESTGKVQDRELKNAIKESVRRKKSMEDCFWCLDSSKRAKHLIVSIGETCYLCLPAEDSLTSLHCLIVPVEHVPCGTMLDEDVWDEIHRFRKALKDMADAEDEDIVMFEQARELNKHPHMVMHCVIMEKETGDLAPIYFKKAILDCESEWATNKKVVDIKGSDVRRSIPKGLPYFSVEFGNSGGFAHVIEDEKMFPKSFAQEVIGGMLDLDHRKWRKALKTSFAAQMEKTVAFARKWGKYDFTLKKKKKKKKAELSSSSSDEN